MTKHKKKSTKAAWLAPLDAARSVAAITGGKTAIELILAHLRGGIVEASAGHISIMPMSGPPKIFKNSLIPSEWWQYIKDASFLETAIARFDFKRSSYRDIDRMEAECFQVVMREDGIAALIKGIQPNLRKTASTKESGTPAQDQSRKAAGSQIEPGIGAAEAEDKKPQLTPSGEAVPTGPPVSDSHLRAWYELYQRVYTGSEDTEGTAIRSATGMFPDKAVTRTRVRALRGTRKRGRPSGRQGGE